MATVLEALKGINPYPIPVSTLTSVCALRAIELDGEANAEVVKSREFRLCRADLLLWLSLAPNITQGGQSYSFTEEQRQQLRNEALALFNELEEDNAPKTIYGYKGSRL